jgi:hypothetical protein
MASAGTLAPGPGPVVGAVKALILPSLSLAVFFGGALLYVAGQVRGDGFLVALAVVILAGSVAGAIVFGGEG